MGGITEQVRGSSKIIVLAAALAASGGCATIVNDLRYPWNSSLKGASASNAPRETSAGSGR